MRLDLQGTKNVDSKNGKNFHAGYTEYSMWVFVHAVKITKVRVNKKIKIRIHKKMPCLKTNKGSDNVTFKCLVLYYSFMHLFTPIAIIVPSSSNKDLAIFSIL